jgi:8-oxo-dGTP pyrophosphatase MutT (NUDIX family)
MTHEVPGDDRAFLCASRIAYDAPEDEWRIEVDPESPLVGPAADVDASALRESEVDRVGTERGYEYRGRLLFSAGVVVLVNGRVVLVRRDPDAPSDPGRWQSPAGRCEEPPGDTALRELYEELVVLEGDRPAFVVYDERSREFEGTYRSTLRRIDRPEPPSEWNRYRGSVPEAAAELSSTVAMEYGERTHTAEMVPFFDERNATLELRYVLAIEVPEPETLRFLDPEFGRTVRRFDPATVVGMDDRDLVPMERYLAETLYPEVA